ncbi:APC amino acid permease [Mycena rebaudengoi]|nr:APC amino acid permease [Mycena rebaudengoi]
MEATSKAEKNLSDGHSERDIQVYVQDADNAKLAELGYKSEFKREFSLLETCAFSFSIMGVLSSRLCGHVGLVFGWLIPGIFVQFVALSMAELASSMPTSAGLYYFSAKLAPAKYAPLASWANITGQIALVCSIDFTCAQMITTAIVVASDGEKVLSLGATYGILLAILFSHGIVCSAATRILARINLFYVVLNVGTTVAAIIALLVVSGDNKVSTKDAFTLFENNTGWANNGWAFMLAFTAPMWTLTGCRSETAGAGRSAPVAILVGVGATASLGWLLLIATSFVIPSIGDLLGTNLPLPMGQVFLDVLGKRGMKFDNLTGMLTIWSFIIIVQYVTGAAQGVDASRVVFAFARDNALPGSKWWKKMNSSAVPVHAVWFVIFFSAMCGLLGFSETALVSLAGASVIGLYTSYATPIFLRITYGRNKLEPGPFHLGRWSTPVGVIAVSWVTFVSRPATFPSRANNYAVVIIMSVFLFATASWVVSAHKWFHGPVRNIDDTIEKRST